MPIFIASVLALIILLWGLGWYAKRWVRTDGDFLLAGRQVSLIPGIASICGIAFAGSMTSIVPGLTIQYGFLGWILGGSLPLVIGYIAYGVFAGPYIRRCGAYTIPEWLEMRFDTRTRVVVSIATLLGVTGVVAMNVVAMALIMQGFLGAPLWLMITIVLGGHLTFIFLGGMWALTLTDVVQVLLGFLFLPALAVYCLISYGGWELIETSFVTATPLSAGVLGSFPWFRLSYPSVLTVSLVIGFFIQWGGNYYWLRAAAARTEPIARWQFIIGGLLVLVIHASMGVLGLYAGSVHSDAFLDPVNPANPMGAYGLLMRDFPAAMALLGLVAALAATISTTSNAHMGITSSLSRDIYQRFIRPNASPEAVLRMSRLLTLLTGFAIWLLSFYPGGPYYLLAVSCAMLGPAACVLLLGHRWAFITPTGAFWGTLAGTVSMLVYEILKFMDVPLGAVHTVVVGSIVTFPTVLGLSVLTQPDGALPDQPQTLRLTPEQERLLILIRTGYTTMVELSDFTMLNSAECHRLIEELERAGLVQRWGRSGLDYFTFGLTPQGDRTLADLPDAPPSLSGFVGLDADSRSILEQLAGGGKSLRTLSTATGVAASPLSVIVNRLDQLGYIRGQGVWERTLTLSEKGRAMVGSVESLGSVESVESLRPKGP
ncbi:MAG: hypothetical protein OXC18_15545 [Desulfurellaceae bacterium]|nr:hypothetical protein [Desulfurellaceae bacterium]